MPNPIKPNLKTEIVPILFLVIAWVASFYFYAHFPTTVATHWNFAGEADGWGNAKFAAFFLPFLCTGIYFLILCTPYIDPKRNQYEKFSGVYHLIKGAIVSFMVIIYFLASINGIGYKISVGTWTPVLVGVLFAIIGNYMGKIKLNWTTGVRTMRSLSSEEAWGKVNRLAGKIFILCGLLMTAEPLLPIYLRLPWFIVIILILIFVPYCYSYICYREEQKNKMK